jgi:2-C-methyl-D-erythritol 4-phosphate cytidylyltransferase/2-C-methyl-D-erythritol 2,4-cyclodiphosphate synthase
VTTPTGPASIAAIVVAAGRGERAIASGTTVPKQYRAIGGVPVLTLAIRALLAEARIGRIVPVIHPEHLGLFAGLGLDDPRIGPPVTGGAERQASVLAGLEMLAAEAPDLVLIQDAARPFTPTEIIAGVIEALEGAAGALPVIPVTDTIKRSFDGHGVSATEDRRTLFAAQTPQGFRFAPILAAHRKAAAEAQFFTDDAAVAEWAGLSVALTPGSRDNVKITHPEDFERAERTPERSRGMEGRTGNGFDVHPFGPGDAVWLGGLRIPHDHGLVGHSDADVALHALSDAIYGALGEGDIGSFFPPSDPRWKGAPSSTFAGHAARLVADRGGRIVNLDLTLVCEAPRIRPHVAAMKARIAEICGIAPSRVAVKATTNEGLGFIGRREGMVAFATATIELPREDER